MRCAVSNGRAGDQIVARIILVAVAVLGCSVGVLPRVASAVDTFVHAAVRDNQPAAMVVTGPANNTTQSSSSVTLTGTVHNISQIIVLIDGVYTTTVPLDLGATTYTIVLIVTPGTHTIVLQGIDPFSGVQIDRSVAVTYDPMQAPTEPTPPPVQQTVGKGTGAAAQLQQQTTQQITTATSNGPLKVMLDGAYGMLTTLGLVTVRDTTGPPTMVWRFILMSTGAVLLVAPWVLTAGLSLLPKAPVRLIACFKRHGIVLRVIGAVLCIIPLFLLI